MADKYINNGQQRITIIDRAKSGNPYTPRRRWVVWNVTTQSVISEHPTRAIAAAALDAV